MTQQERELVWLLDKIKEEERLISQAETFFAERQPDWSRAFVAWFAQSIKELQDQLSYKEHRLEQLGWQIIQYRELEIGVPSDP